MQKVLHNMQFVCSCHMWLDLCLASNEFALSPAALYWACVYICIYEYRGISQTIHSHGISISYSYV